MAHNVCCLESNVRAVTAVAEVVRSTYGPHGMDKLLSDHDAQRVVVTNGELALFRTQSVFQSSSTDGATILGLIDVEHPAAQLMVELSQSQEEQV